MTRTTRDDKVLVLCKYDCGNWLHIQADFAPKDWTCPRCEQQEWDDYTSYIEALNVSTPTPKEPR